MTTEPTSSANRFRFRVWIPQRKDGDEIIPAKMVYNPKVSKQAILYYDQRTLNKLEESSIYLDDALGSIAEGGAILMQSTGLKDRNGKEIFECDWLGGLYECFVGWCAKQGGFQLFTCEKECLSCMGDVHWEEVARDKDLEVTDNIYENPELLK